jgi:hypothetical protein
MSCAEWVTGGDPHAPHLLDIEVVSAISSTCHSCDIRT